MAAPQPQDRKGQVLRLPIPEQGQAPKKGGFRVVWRTLKDLPDRLQLMHLLCAGGLLALGTVAWMAAFPETQQETVRAPTYREQFGTAKIDVQAVLGITADTPPSDALAMLIPYRAELEKFVIQEVLRGVDSGLVPLVQHQEDWADHEINTGQFDTIDPQVDINLEECPQWTAAPNCSLLRQSGEHIEAFIEGARVADQGGKNGGLAMLVAFGKYRAANMALFNEPQPTGVDWNDAAAAMANLKLVNALILKYSSGDDARFSPQLGTEPNYGGVDAAVESVTEPID